MPKPWMLGLIAAGLTLAAPSVRAAGKDDMSSYYPAAAMRVRQDGQARIACTVTPDGHLTDCSVVSEDPPAFGFGDAALKLAHLFIMKTQTADGHSTAGSHIVVPINFKAP